MEGDLPDLTTVAPYDWNSIEDSVKRNHKVMIVHEESLSWGYGAELAARIQDELFDYLDAPVRRVGAMDCFVAYAPELEEVILPQPEKVAQAARDLALY